MDNPHIIACGNHHVSCFNCIVKWWRLDPAEALRRIYTETEEEEIVELKVCQECKEIADPSQLLPATELQRIINHIVYHCKNSTNGCKWICPINTSPETMKLHENDCR